MGSMKDTVAGVFGIPKQFNTQRISYNPANGAVTSGLLTGDKIYRVCSVDGDLTFCLAPVHPHHLLSSATISGCLVPEGKEMYFATDNSYRYIFFEGWTTSGLAFVTEMDNR